MKVITLYKSAVDLNTLLFYPAGPKIGHGQDRQAQVASMYVHVVPQ